MIHQCRFCLHIIHLVPGRAAYCQCGAVYTGQMLPGKAFAYETWGNKDYDALHRQAVPQAFYDAFKDEELKL